jgi:hypothetical protein
MSNFNNFSNQPPRFKLASNKAPKLNCPYCGAKRHWQRYIDIETDEVLPEHWGRCDNDNKCRQWNDPYKEGYAKAIWEQERGDRLQLPTYWKQRQKKVKPPPKPEPVFFNYEVFKKTLQPDRYIKNVFLQNLFHSVDFPFEIGDITNVIELYRLGTIAKGNWTGCITFPYIDKNQNIRTIQVKRFDNKNKTKGQNKLDKVILSELKKENRAVPEWLKNHIEYGDKEGYYTCLFGEHNLLKYPNAKIYLFEAPKTAVYATLYFGRPEITNTICLAVYNKSSFSFEKLKVLQGRFVYVFPDLSKDGATFKEWESKGKEFESCLPKTRFIFSDLLEQLAPDRDKEEGNDLADYLINQDWRLFRELNILEQPPQPEKVTKVTKVTLQQNNYFPTETGSQSKIESLKTKKGQYSNLFEQPEPTEDWSSEIKELENYFNSVTIPENTIKLNQCELVTDPKKLIEWNMTAVKANNGNKYFKDSLEALKQLRTKHNEQQN